METPEQKIEFIPMHHFKWFPVNEQPDDVVLGIVPGKPDFGGFDTPDKYFILKQWWNKAHRFNDGTTVTLPEGEWRDIEIDWKNENKPPSL